MAKPCMYNLRELMAKPCMCNSMKLADQNGKNLTILARHVKHYPGKENISLGEVYTL